MKLSNKTYNIISVFCLLGALVAIFMVDMGTTPLVILGGIGLAILSGLIASYVFFSSMFRAFLVWKRWRRRNHNED